MNNNENSCDYKSGPLPACAPLAAATIPPQQSSTPAYEPKMALMRGTLFPGLDLPFMNMVNNSLMTDTPLCEVMTIDFVVNELGLYLDTHSDDAEAFETFRSFLKLSDEAHRRYAKLYGPISRTDMAEAKSFTWIKDPWPWDGITERRGDK